MWQTSKCPTFLLVWITVNKTVHPAMFDGITYKTPNGDYTAVDAWAKLEAPRPYNKKAHYANIP
jgi:hypothetical protein